VIKKILLIITILLITGVAFAATPVIFYSDLTSGPKVGGQDNKGVFVSIYGKNFGSSQGGAYVSIGGGQADNYPVWSDTKISFQLGSAAATGNIMITTSEGTSNGVPFTVRSGNIYFVDDSAAGAGTGTFADPWQSPASYYAKINANEDGSTCYFRAGTYSGQYGYPGWHANFCFLTQDGGAEGQENAFIGYPGEVATIQTAGVADRNNFRDNNGATYIIVANLRLIANNSSIGAVDNWRVIGNKITGCTAAVSASGIVGANGTNIKIYGNEITGGTSGNKLDHAFYPNEGENIDFGWNWIHDNDFSWGPMISTNRDGSNTSGLQYINYRYHDNIIDMSDHPSRAIGVADVGNDSTIYIYNNVIIGPSLADAYAPVLYAWYGTLYYYNNTIYNCGNSGATNDIFWMGSSVKAATFKNNIVYANSTCKEYMDIDGGTIINENNCWYGIGDFANHSSGASGTNAGAVEADPLFVDASNKDFHLKDNSPCIDKGKDVSNVVVTDKDGNIRAVPDIGTYEYGSGGTGTSSSGSSLLSTDTTPPAAITTLRVTGYSRNSITLYWFAPGDDGNIGTAASYE